MLRLDICGERWAASRLPGAGNCKTEQFHTAICRWLAPHQGECNGLRTAGRGIRKPPMCRQGSKAVPRKRSWADCMPPGCTAAVEAEAEEAGTADSIPACTPRNFARM